MGKGQPHFRTNNHRLPFANEWDGVFGIALEYEMVYGSNQHGRRTYAWADELHLTCPNVHCESLCVHRKSPARRNKCEPVSARGS
ncbi:hypothetical protein AVEN_122745-1 [Araneus ventricosus]|uniref:Uncharacterized protein n=1 Tax=Araneus ventricosus TaxID=182803 RepID=A0A4Y2ND42_ARAVE|nr:hypothetical protein AVEN_122745-1 [Araneus ventricosus]